MTSRPRIAFQGDPGANSDEACRAYVPTHEPVPHAAFDEAFEAVKSGDCALAMIPVENSIAGRVADVHHLLPSSGLRISMPFAASQCRRVLRRLGVAIDPAGDTAGSAKALAARPDPSRAAIAPALAASLYGLDIVLRDIEDEAHNTTRFLVLTADQAPAAPPAGAECVTSFAFRVRNLPAALYKALGGFATNGVNMTKLESYMENGAFTATFFFAEVDGRPDQPALARAFEELNFFSDHFEIMGVYPADPFRQARAAAV
jgi:prephenate dehydratase